MSEDYGKQITVALRAVEQLHADSSKLLVDFDKCMTGWRSVFGNYATRDLKYNVRSDCYMAEGVYRYYFQKELPQLIRALTICFFDRRTDEPLLLVAEIKYRKPDGDDPKVVCQEWDLWNLHFDSNEKLVLGQVLALSDPTRDGRIETARLIALPLYTIQRVEDVEQLMRDVVQAPP